MINSDANYYKQQNPGWPIYNPSWAIVTPGTNELFNTAITYAKGSCVLAMARYVLGSELFFSTFRSYATDSTFRYKNASIPEFIVKMSEASGQDLTWFFEQWLYEPNHPSYSNTYWISQPGSRDWTLNFKARQTQSGSVYYKMPIELKISFTSGADTTIRVFNDQNNQIFTFNFDRQPSSLVFDPNDEIVLKTANTVMSTEDEQLSPLEYTLYSNYPNPFNPSTTIKFAVPEGSDVKLSVFNTNGEEVGVIASGYFESGIHKVEFNANNLPSGIYFAVLNAGGKMLRQKMILLK